MDKKYMDPTLERIERASKAATLLDNRIATRIREYAQQHDFTPDEGMAICVRFGVQAGTKFGKDRAHEAYRLLHDYKGTTLEDQANKAAERLKDPAELRKLAAFVEGRIAALEAETTEAMAAAVEEAEAEGPTAQAANNAPAADENAATENDVNSNGDMEV